MFILPVDSTCSLLCVAISFVYESFRIFAAYFATRPSDELRLLKIQKADTLIEIASIKSVNLDFVKHSLLTRKVIKIEKKIETFQSQHAPKVTKVKNFFRVCRIVFYLVCGIYLSQVSLVMVNPKVFWPISWLARGDLVFLSPLSVLCVSGLAFRHILRTFSSIFCCNVVLP